MANSSYDKLNLNKLGDTGETTNKVLRESDYKRKSNEELLDNLEKFIGVTERLKIQPLVAQNGQWSLEGLAELIDRLHFQNKVLSTQLKSAKSTIEDLRKKLKEMESFNLTFGHDEAYEKWKKAQRTGRTPKTVDWEKYDHLVAAGLAQKDILQYLGISGNTLRKKLKEREAQKDR